MFISTNSFAYDLVVFIVTLTVVIYGYFKWSFQYWKRRNFPYLEPKIPFGNLPNPLTSNLSQVENAILLYNEAKARGFKHCGIYSLSIPTYMVVDLDLLKCVMAKDFNHFVDRGGYFNEKDDPMGCNLFTTGGKKWRNLRTKLTPTFTSGKMKMMFQTVADCGTILEKYIEENIADKQVVDIKKILAGFTTDVIGSCAFGLELNSFTKPDSVFDIYRKRIFATSGPELLKLTFAASFPRISRALGIRLFKKDVSDFYTKIVEDTVSYREKNNVVRNDFLQLLMQMRSKEDYSTGDGSTLTMQEVVAQSFAFFFGGFETSSTTMSFALFELARNPEIQDKAREEIRAVFAKHDNKITYEAMNDLVYLKQVIDETFRIYPPVPLITRECVKDYTVPGENVVVEKGTSVLLPVIGIHRDEEYYPNPEKFDPDRFSVENKKNRPQYAHIPFGEGPRICIGERFGLLQTKIGLSSVLKNFKVSLNERTKLPLKMDPLLLVPSITGGMWLNIDRI